MFEMDKSKYFNALPDEVKQRIRDSKRKFYSEKDLREFVASAAYTGP